EDKPPVDCQYAYSYDQNGRLVEEVASDANGAEAWRLHYTSGELAQFTRARRPGSEAPAGLPAARTRTGVVFVRFEWSDEGHARRVHYLDTHGRAVPDRGGAYGMVHEYDEQGREVRATFVGEKGTSVRGRTGKYATVVTRHDGPHLVEQSFL